MQSLDGVLNGLHTGDNVVWQVDGIADSKPRFYLPDRESRTDDAEIAPVGLR